MGTITGVIFWDPSVLNNTPKGAQPTLQDRIHQITPLDTSRVNKSLVITANQFIPGPGFGSDQVKGTGQVTSANTHEALFGGPPPKPFTVQKSCSASYEIGNLPLNASSSLYSISAKSPFIGGENGIIAVPLGGTAFVTLTNPSQQGPNFFLRQA
jgi:hypothetical protein